MHLRRKCNGRLMLYFYLIKKEKEIIQAMLYLFHVNERSYNEFN